MKLPSQQVGETIDVSDTSELRNELMPQACHCLETGVPGQCAWFCIFGRDYVPTGIPCTEGDCA